MALLQLNLNPSKKELRWFAGLWFPAFWGVIGLLVWRHHAHSAAFAIWGCAALLAIAGFVATAVIRPVYIVMMRATYPIGWVTSNIVLVAAYFLVITPIGRLIRVFHDPMRRTLDRSAKSYWMPWEPTERNRYFRQM